ncbi:MAG: polysaccharide pyruvyl transferase family protein, partial [Planctomycetes bacterium]|nr:polysaccharide pyruvyl transferase family protein [Planctomycetota bacterium]
MRSLLKVYSWKPGEGSNFGDAIGPMVVDRLAKSLGHEVEVIAVSSGESKLLAIGSIVHEAKEGDHIWGSGINGKSNIPENLRDNRVEVHSLRGPVTGEILRSLGKSDPEVYGDPGLLFPILFENEIEQRAAEIEAWFEAHDLYFPRTLFIPNLNDERFYQPDLNDIPDEWLYVSPAIDPITVAASVRLCDNVFASSLHGIVFGDAYHKDVTFIASRFEPLLKYDDYFLGTGRRPVRPYRSIVEAKDGPNVDPCRFDPYPLIAAFPLAKTDGADGLVKEIPSLRVGQRYEIGESTGEADVLGIFARGWSSPQDGSVWTIAKRVTLLFATDEWSGRPLRLRMLAGTLEKGS